MRHGATLLFNSSSSQGRSAIYLQIVNQSCDSNVVNSISASWLQNIYSNTVRSCWKHSKVPPFILVIAVSSLICYKLIMRRKKERKKPLYEKTPSKFAERFMSTEKGLNIFSLDSFYFDEILPSPPAYSLKFEPSESGTELCLNNLSVDKYFLTRSNSTSLSSLIGDGTVAKLDKLLQLTEEIKESIGEMNADILEARRLDKKPHETRLSTDLMTFIDEELVTVNEELETPSLEWDPNDIRLYSEQESLIASESLESFSPLNKDFRSPTSSSESASCSISHSELQTVSSEEEVHRLKLVQNLIDEAREQGLLPDLMRFLLKNSNRDSAYFED